MPVMKRIFIDPGHGGSDRYNRGPTGYVEADGALDIALKLRNKLQSVGFDVGMTRDKDATVALPARGKMAGQYKADLFLSIHSNAGSAVATGTEVYYSVNLPQTKAIAAKMSKAVANILGIPDRGAKVRESQNYPGKDYYTVINTAQDTGVPRVFLIEVAFHSNPKEEALLKQSATREKVARALADVIADTFGVQGTTPQITSMADIRGVDYTPKQQNIKQEVVLVDNIVVYNNDVDKRAAEYLADYLRCPIVHADNYKTGMAKKVFAIGASKIAGATALTGSDRYETLKEVLNFMGKL